MYEYPAAVVAADPFHSRIAPSAQVTPLVRVLMIDTPEVVTVALVPEVMS